MLALEDEAACSFLVESGANSSMTYFVWWVYQALPGKLCRLDISFAFFACSEKRGRLCLAPPGFETVNPESLILRTFFVVSLQRVGRWENLSPELMRLH